jgi:hypothetical protein
MEGILARRVDQPAEPTAPRIVVCKIAKPLQVRGIFQINGIIPRRPLRGGNFWETALVGELD